MRFLSKAIGAGLLFTTSAVSFGQNAVVTASTSGPLNALQLTAVASIPSNYVGNNSKIWLAALIGSDVYFLDDSGKFAAYTGGLAALLSASRSDAPALRLITSGKETISIQGDASAVVGGNVYMGYGTGFSELVNAGHFKRAFTFAPIVSNDTAAYSTKIVGNLLSLAGEYIPFGPLANTALIDFYGVARMGIDQQEGVVLTGWAYTGFTNTAADITTVNVAVLGQNQDGSLKMTANEVVPSTLTNGAGSVVVADFNGDGKDDIFLAAHNESPFKLKASTVYLSKPDGSFDKLTLNDAVMAHDANLGTVNGKTAVVITSFGGGVVPAFSAAYTYNNAGGFNITPIRGVSSNLSAMSVATGDFLNLGHHQFVYGDLVEGPGYNYASSNTFHVSIYDFNGFNLTGNQIQLPAPYFNGKTQYAGISSNWDPTSKSHQSRVWTDDINQDGRPDIIVGTEIWPGWKSQLQLLVNQGAGIFSDQTNTLNFPWNEDGGFDYSLRMIDVDGSGINSYFAAQPPAYCQTPNCRTNNLHGNYVLVNDGTGRFYSAMHDEFVSLGNQVTHFLKATLSTSTYFVNTDTPRFIAYRNANGLINFVAKAGAIKMINGVPTQISLLVNVPLQINLANDFRKNIVITSRNGSRNIRTFAGDDTIVGGCNGTCNLNGGQGLNTIVYAGKRANYSILRSSEGISVKDNVGSDGTDNIKNIQILRFADASIDLRSATLN